MALTQDRLTLDALLSDPLTQLVMRSDGITSDDVAQAFAIARTGLSEVPVRRGGMCTTFERWISHGIAGWTA